MKMIRPDARPEKRSVSRAGRPRPAHPNKQTRPREGRLQKARAPPASTRGRTTTFCPSSSFFIAGASVAFPPPPQRSWAGRRVFSPGQQEEGRTKAPPGKSCTLAGPFKNGTHQHLFATGNWSVSVAVSDCCGGCAFQRRCSSARLSNKSLPHAPNKCHGTTATTAISLPVCGRK